jgi:hypothetical protein
MGRITFLVLASSLALASPSAGSLINPTVTIDTPELWVGSIDWAGPTSVDNAILDAAPNWSVGVVEVPVGGPFAVLFVSILHLVAPHAPPSPAAFFLFPTFGPIAPGGVATATYTDNHADDAGHVDSVVANLAFVNATTSRLNLTITHTPASAPEPASGVLVLGSLLGVRMWRRRSGA